MSASHRSARNREADRRVLRDRLLPAWTRLRRDVLSEREALVLSLRVGIVSDRPFTHEVIARRLQLSKASIVKIERGALRKCDNLLSSDTS